jgi:hypothetical protein
LTVVSLFFDHSGECPRTPRLELNSAVFDPTRFDLNSVKDVGNLDNEIASLVVAERLEDGHTAANERLKNSRFAELTSLLWMVGHTHI